MTLQNYWLESEKQESFISKLTAKYLADLDKHMEQVEREYWRDKIALQESLDDTDRLIAEMDKAMNELRATL